MEIKKIKEEKLRELQQMTNKYSSEKRKRQMVRLVAGFFAGASIVLLASCSDQSSKEVPKETNEYNDYINEVYTRAWVDSVPDKEQQLEKEIAEYLSAKTGVKIEMIDMRSIDVVKSSGNYVVITGEMITDAREGRKECSVTLSLSDEQIEAFEKTLDRHHYAHVEKIVGSEAGISSLTGEDDILAYKYSSDFLLELKNLIDSPETSIEAIYDKDNKEWIFDVEEPTPSSKR